MILTVKCSMCQTVLVVVEKPEITQQDQDSYKQATRCDCCQMDDMPVDCIVTEE